MNSLDVRGTQGKTNILSTEKFIVNKKEFYLKSPENRKQIFNSYIKPSSFPKSKNENSLFITKEIQKTKVNPFRTNVCDKSSFVYFYQNENNFLSPQQMKFFYPDFPENYKPDINMNFMNITEKENEKSEIPATTLKTLNINDNIQNEQQNTSPTQQRKFKENYLDLLIEAADELITNGLDIDLLAELKLPSKSSHSSKHHSNQSRHITSSSSVQNFKCENKVCPVYFAKKSNFFIAKITSLKNKTLRLCSQCHQAWKNGQYCYYCGVIYRQYRGTKGFNDHKTWIGCEFCNNWEHVQCEEQKGVYSNLSQLIKKDKHLKYKCPVCRSKNRDTSNSRKCSVTKEDTDKSFLGAKRKNEPESGKRRIKKRKEFDEINNTDKKGENKSENQNSHTEQNDILDDIEALNKLDKLTNRR